MIIAVDFDGTCVPHDFPHVGQPLFGCVEVLQELVKKGHKIILWTMRSDVEDPKSTDPTITNLPGPHLTNAVEWFKKHDIPLFGIQRNPEQDNWTSSPKAYAQLYIDDAALGCPLIYPADGSRPYVDWIEVRNLLVKSKLL